MLFYFVSVYWVSSIFPNSVDLFFYQQFLLIVEKRGLDNLFVNDLEGIFLALDMDFDFSTRLFLRIISIKVFDDPIAKKKKPDESDEERIEN